MKKILSAAVLLAILFACNEQPFEEEVSLDLKSGKGKALGQNSINFTLLSDYEVGGEGAAEISAFDPVTNQLFVVNNDEASEKSRIDVLILTSSGSLSYVTSIEVSGGSVNSVAVKNGLLAAAVENDVKTDDGTVVVYNTSNLNVVTTVTVGALPDMVTFTPDGMYILSANEGEPNDDYDDDPEGTISIINVGNYSVSTLDFSGFALQEDELKAKGLRIFGPEASFTQDIEPEYITVSEDSKTAWVTLQENNAMAKVDIESQTILEILPFGFKDYNVPQNQIDVSDKDGGYFPGRWPVYGMYLPDGVAMLTDNGVPYIFTANEGDSRDYDGYSEELRIGELDDDDNIILKLDTNIFPNAEWLQMEENLGRLKITTSMGDTDNDGEYDELYSYGARSFSVWDGNSGEQIFDSRNELDRQANNNGVYRDSRSDDKSIEPEGVVVGNIGNIKLLFVGMERVDAVAVYDVTNPRNPKYLQWLSTNTVGGDLGDAAPEGLLFIPADESPTGTSLLVVSNEASGNVVVYTNNQPL